MVILKALIKKEILQILRDPSALLIAFVLPLLLLFIFGYGVNLDSSRFKVGIFSEKSTPASISLLSSFSNSEFFEVETAQNREILNKKLSEAQIRALIIIPAEFNKNTLAQKANNIQIITDGSEPNIATFVSGYAEGVINNWLLQQQHLKKEYNPLPITIESRFWYNPELKSRNFLIPGSLAIIMTSIGVLLTALVIAREWERGTMEALMATPISIKQILIGKLIPYFFLAVLSLIMCWLIAVLWYKIPFRGSFIALLVLSSSFLLAALAQGLFISSVSKNQHLASQLALITAFLPAFILSGFIFEITSMPWPIQGVSFLIAAKYFVASLQSLFLAGDIWPLFLRSIIAMLAIGLVFLILTLKKTNKRLD